MPKKYALLQSHPGEEHSAYVELHELRAPKILPNHKQAPHGNGGHHDDCLSLAPISAD